MQDERRVNEGKVAMAKATIEATAASFREEGNVEMAEAALKMLDEPDEKHIGLFDMMVKDQHQGYSMGAEYAG